jgi:FKBP-type peptidyl-prolyl cis-trans isomerase
MTRSLSLKGSYPYIAMQMKNWLVALTLWHLCTLSAWLNAQTFVPDEGFTAGANKTYYKIHGFSAGKRPVWGDIIKMSLEKYDPEGQLMFSTALLDTEGGVEMELKKDGWDGDITEIFLLIHSGDAATVYVPKWIADKDSSLQSSDLYYRYEVALHQFTERKEYEQKKADRLEKLRTIELTLFDSIVKAFPVNNVRQLPSGVTIIKTLKPAHAKPISAGENISVHYVLKLIKDDKMLDNSYNRGTPFSFPVGEGQVIKGWDEALLQMKKGEKAIVLIPSWMAYGERGAGPDIAPDTPLYFEIEVLKEP